MHLLRERFSFVAVTSIVLAAFGCGGSAGTGDEPVDSNQQAVETVPQCTVEGCDPPAPTNPCDEGYTQKCDYRSNPTSASVKTTTVCWCEPDDCQEVPSVICHGQLQPEGTPVYPGCIVTCLSAM